MNSSQLARMDLNLLRLFHTIYAAKGVSAAATRLGVTQSAVSHGLARLRAAFGDALFVRSGLALVPTARADSLFVSVQAMLEIFEHQIARPVSFEPRAQAHSFTLAMSDMAELVLLPLLIQKLRAAAPQCILRVSRLQTRRVAEALDTGRAELTIGIFPDPPAHLYRQTLYEQNFVVIAWTGHPRLKSRLTWQAYERAEHVIADTGADQYLEASILAPLGIKRRARVSVEGSLAIPWLLKGTDLIATVPARLDDEIARAAAVRQFQLPSKAKPYPLQSMWHPRVHDEPAHRWLRESIFEWMNGSAS
jgi:DNA-binding transcriptional LysR family regulator